MRRALRSAALASLVLLALLGVGMGALVWRASREPISVAFLIPRLEAAINTGEGAPVTRIGSLAVVWSSAEGELALRAGAITVAEAGGARAVTIAGAEVQLDPWALLHGRIALSEIDVDRAAVRVARRRDGSFGLNLEPSVPAPPGAEAEAEASPAGPALIALATGQGPLAALRELRLHQSAALLVDEATGRSWRATSLDLTITRAEDAVQVRGGFALELGAAVVPCDATAALDPRDESGSASLAFRQLVPSAVAASLRGVVDVVEDPSVGPVLASLTMPVEGTAEARFAQGFSLAAARLAISGGSAELALPGVASYALGVKQFSLTTTYDVPNDRLTLDSASLDVGDATLGLAAQLAPVRGASALDATAKIALLPTDALARLWPKGVAEGARSWVTRNVSGGAVRDLVVRARGTQASDATGAPSIDALDGAFTFEGLGVRYVGTMPVVKNVKGRGSFSLTGLDFDVSGGRLEQLDVTGGKVKIALPAKGSSTIAIEASVRGPLSSALQVTAAEPLRVASAIGVDPSTVGGAVDATARFGFPLGVSLSGNRLRWSVDATLKDAAVPRLIGDWSIAGGALKLSATPAEVAVTGTASVAGAPVEGSFRQALQGARAQTADVRARVDRAQRAALGVDPGAWLDGPVDVAAKLDSAGPGRATLALDVDLAPATIALPALAIDKPSGAPGRARGRLTLVKNRIASVAGVEVAAAGATLHGDAQRTDDGARWKKIVADLSLPVPGDPTRPARARAQLQPSPKGYAVSLSSPDVGAIFAAYGRPPLKGGAATFTGTLEGEPPRAPLVGHFEAKTFTVGGVPWLVRLTTLASVSGLTSALTGSGVAFTEATAEIAVRGDTVTITSGVAEGPTMTVGIDGAIDTAQGTIEAKGTLLPIAFDRLTEKIPLIGSLVGAATRSVFEGVDFSLSGPVGDPKVSVYPLSSLTPGALKSIMRAIER